MMLYALYFKSRVGQLEMLLLCIKVHILPLKFRAEMDAVSH
jgi:hypothetical protein